MLSSASVRAWSGWGIAALAGLAILAGCGSPAKTAPGQKRFVVLMNGESPFWVTLRRGIETEAKKLGVNATLETNNATPAGQIEKLRQFGTQRDIAAVGVSVTDAANPAIADEMKKLQARGVHVITVDSDVDRDKFRDARFAFIGTDNLAGGREMGLAARNLRPEGGGFVTFVGRTGAQNAIERIGGFGQGAGENFRELDKMGDENDRTRAKENVRNAIRNHPDDLKCLVGIWSYNAPAIVDVVREMGNRSKFTIVAFDAEPNAIRYLAEGDIDALVVQNPFEMGVQAVRLMKALDEKDEATIDAMFPRRGEPDGDIYDTGLKVVVPDERSPLTAEMFGPQTEFLKLGDFRRWLDEYQLTGS